MEITNLSDTEFKTMVIRILKELSENFNSIKKRAWGPDLCGSVAWALSHKAKGHWFDSMLGHMPGWQVQSLVRVHTRSNQLMFLSHINVSLPFSLPLLPSL